MKILVDTREQKPLEFAMKGSLKGVVKATLPVGDYMAEFEDGSRPPVAFERKSVADLFGTMGKGYGRFKREMQRAEALGIALVLAVEGTPADVWRGADHSEVPGGAVVKKLMTLWVRYDLVPMFAASRAEMAGLIREFYEALERSMEKGRVGARIVRQLEFQAAMAAATTVEEIAANEDAAVCGDGYEERVGLPG